MVSAQTYFQVRRLREDDLPLIRELIQAAYGRRDRAPAAVADPPSPAGSEATATTSGGIVLTGPTGHIYGFFRYALHWSAATGRVLTLYDFCALPPAGRQAAIACLIGAAERIATERDCTGLAIEPIADSAHDPTEPSQYDLLSEYGYLAGSAVWRKLLP
jgi:hypothetical protein